jgi:hypothetical protein
MYIWNFIAGAFVVAGLWIASVGGGGVMFGLVPTALGFVIYLLARAVDLFARMLDRLPEPATVASPLPPVLDGFKKEAV